MFKPFLNFSSLLRSSVLPQHASRSSTQSYPAARRLWSSFKAGDRVLLSWVQGRDSRRKLTKPLRHDGITIVNNHEIPHSDVIGKPSNLFVEKLSSEGRRRIVVKADHPSLDEFIALTPRRVAPVYATYAATIVDQLDLHSPPPSSVNDPSVVNGPSLQVLEAGTGHGSLTIHLARAIAAANPPPPSIQPSVASSTHDTNDASFVEDKANLDSETWTTWRRQRRAVIHTVEVNKENSEHAEKVIKSFRNGLYWPHIDFYSAKVQDWVASKVSANDPSPFLDAAVLDMPNVHDAFAPVSRVLNHGGRLLAFTPQITQIAACVQHVKDERLPFTLERVLELGDGISNGRLWDVRVASLRSAKSPENEDSNDSKNTESEGSTEEDLDQRSDMSGLIRPMVCRPLVGESTRGGGFIGLWRRRGDRAPIEALN